MRDPNIFFGSFRQKWRGRGPDLGLAGEDDGPMHRSRINCNTRWSMMRLVRSSFWGGNTRSSVWDQRLQVLETTAVDDTREINDLA
ncbi:MAG TPA: hypothetical protein VF228_13010, partial [Iamia sp.]